MDPTIYYCNLSQHEKTSLKDLSLVTYPTINAFELDHLDQVQIKYKEYYERIRSSYLKTEDSLLFANIDALFNFSQRSGGMFAPQEEKNRVYYTKGIFSKGLDEYMKFRFKGADGMYVKESIDDLVFKLHLLEVPVMNYHEMDAQLSISFGLGIDLYVAPAEMKEIYLCGRHLKDTGYAIFFFNSEYDKLTGKEFRKLLTLFVKVSVFKPLILTGTSYYVCVCSEFKLKHSILVAEFNLEVPDITFELENFEKMVVETFNDQNKLNLLDRTKFNLSKASVVWNIH